jgi:hypothetical protein
MSATITWKTTGPPGQGVGHAPPAQKTGGAGDEKHQAGTQNGGTNVRHKRAKWQYPPAPLPGVHVAKGSTR